MIILASDHVGFSLKEEIRDYLVTLGFSCKDLGCNSAVRVDYPVYAYQAAKEVIKNDCNRGLLFCGTGVGMAIAANKVPSIRAVVCTDCYSAQMSREHNDTNVLAMGAKVVDELLAKKIIKIWLETNFQGGRHQERVKMITSLEAEAGKFLNG